MFTENASGSQPTDFSTSTINNWGDNTSSAAAGVIQDANGTYHLLANHTYAADGTYSISGTLK
jgi:hypothetical protein